MQQLFGRTRIKVCGVRSYDLAMAAVDAGVDAIGFVFLRSSPKFIEPQEAFEIMSNLPPLVATVGVFEDQTIEEFLDIEEACPTTYTQLNGSEPERFVKQAGPDVIRTIHFDPEVTPQALMNWDAVDEVGAILMDISASTGTVGEFNWNQLPPMLDDVAKPVFLSGGLTAAGVGAAIRTIRPYAVELSSGVDIDLDGDIERIEEFCRAVREADRA